MMERNLKQVDILNLCEPYCEKYKVRLAKNDLSQYINGKSEPKQDKLTILGLALNVNEVWLMGYDIPREVKALETENPSYKSNNQNISKETLKFVHKYQMLDDIDKVKINERVDMLLEDEKYDVKKEYKNA
ncbi:MAG: transcriptional regulator [Lachnospirales bacterium]